MITHSHVVNVVKKYLSTQKSCGGISTCGCREKKSSTSGSAVSPVPRRTAGLIKLVIIFIIIFGVIPTMIHMFS